MKVAFKHVGSGVFSKLISFWTRSKFSHAEIVFENPYPICFSSDENDGGTRFKSIVDLIDQNKWTVLPVLVTPGQEIVAFDLAKTKLNGLKYNWEDIASFLLHNIDASKNNKWICSAVCLRIIQECNLYRNVRCTDCSPELLFELVSSLGDKNAGS